MASLRSQVVDCQFEITPLSPQDGHCHVILSSAHRRYSITPEQAWRPGRRRHLIRRVACSLAPPAVAAATIAVSCAASRRAGVGRPIGKLPVSSAIPPAQFYCPLNVCLSWFLVFPACCPQRMRLRCGGRLRLRDAAQSGSGAVGSSRISRPFDAQASTATTPAFHLTAVRQGGPRY